MRTCLPLVGVSSACPPLAEAVSGEQEKRRGRCVSTFGGSSEFTYRGQAVKGALLFL
jgi:hypothetical protein